MYVNQIQNLITKEWMDKESQKFEIFISETVINECSDGDKNAAKERMELLEQFEVLELKPDALNLSKELVDNKIVPIHYPEDALHIAVATTNGIDYLLTWNCKHIANALMRVALEKLIKKNGYILPVICTPEELMGE